MWILIPGGVVPLNFKSEIVKVGQGCRVVRLSLVGHELGNCNGRQDTDDGDDDHQFDKGEAFAVFCLFSYSSKHVVPPCCCR